MRFRVVGWGTSHIALTQLSGLISYLAKMKDKYTIEDHIAKLRYADTTTGKIAFLDRGQGHTILLVHGIPTNSWLYRDIVDPLVQAGYRVIVPDMLGFGQSDKPDDQAMYTPDLHSQRLEQLLGAVDVDDFSIVVHDAGGPWSYPMIQKFSHKLKRLVFLNTIICTEGFKPPIRFGEDSFFAKTLGKLYDSRPIGKMIMNSTLKAGTSKHKMKGHERRGYWHSLQHGADAPIQYFFGHLETMEQSAHDFQAFVKKTPLPIGAVWGMEDDILVGDIQIPHLQKYLHLQDENIYKLPESSHFLTEEEPESVAEYILKLIRA